MRISKPTIQTVEAHTVHLSFSSLEIKKLETNNKRKN